MQTLHRKARPADSLAERADRSVFGTLLMADRIISQNVAAMLADLHAAATLAEVERLGGIIRQSRLALSESEWDRLEAAYTKRKAYLGRVLEI